MNVKRTILILLALLTILAMTSCEMITDFIDSRTRPIPVIEIFNGNMEKTLKMLPNDTLYVRVQGLAADSEHTVQVLDPLGKVVSELVTYSDKDGKIDMTPLWYDIGFKIDSATGRIYLDKAGLSVKAFYIQVADGLDTPETDFKIPFFFINTNEEVERKQPIVMGGKVIGDEGDEEFIPWNAFYSDQQVLGDLEYIDQAGNVVTPTEYEEFTNTLYVKIDQLEQLTEDADIDDEVRIWILPTRSTPFQDGESIGASAYFYQTFYVSDFAEDQHQKILWPQTLPTFPVDITPSTRATDTQYEIPEWAEERDFTIFADMKNKGKFGIYEIMKEGFASYYLDGMDGNGVAGFIVKASSVEVPADITSMQLASNGIYNGDWHWNITDNGYVDDFKQDGSDTYGSYYAPRGVKVSWNPYVSKAYPYYSSSEGEGDELSSYVGQYVDVYVVRAAQSLDEGADIDDEYAAKRTIPIQFSCRNGYKMQTIWRAPYGGSGNTDVLGDYIIVVDMDRNGEISDGDLVDDVRVDNATNQGGFSIIAN